MAIRPLGFICHKPVADRGEEQIDFLWWTIEKDNVMAGGSGFTSLAAWRRSNRPL
jgi:hypothetical protein